MNKWKEMTESIANTNIPEPLFYGDLLGVSIFIWRKPQFNIEVCETYPYESDGSVELIFIQVAWFEVMFYSKVLYKFLYRRKYGYNPKGLE